MNIGVWLSYDGTRYDGQQKQGNTDRTIQGRLEAVLEKLKDSPVEVRGSGRIDAEVHAESQAASFHLAKNMTSDEVMRYMNRYLPENIAVTRVCVMSERFHSRLNALRKTYRYQIEAAPKKNVFERYCYYGLGQDLDVGKMEQAAAILTGTHDYKSFCGNKKMKKSTIHIIESICFYRMGSRIHISFTGNGFLQQMVRILSGTLIEVGTGKRKPEEMAAILGAGDRSMAGLTAPPEGLFLEKVEHGDLIRLDFQ